MNEQINLMGQTLLRQLLVGIHGAMWYAVMADETCDISNHEQVTVCIGWADKYYGVHEDFISLVNVTNAMAESITSILTDILIRCNLPLSMCRGQAYDGAANMSGGGGESLEWLQRYCKKNQPPYMCIAWLTASAFACNMQLGKLPHLTCHHSNWRKVFLGTEVH